MELARRAARTFQAYIANHEHANEIAERECPGTECLEDFYGIPTTVDISRLIVLALVRPLVNQGLEPRTPPDAPYAAIVRLLVAANASIFLGRLEAWRGQLHGQVQL